MTEYYRQQLDDRLLQLARQAIYDGQSQDWSMEEIVDRFASLVDDHSELAVVEEERLNAAMEQAAYILDYEPGYVEYRDYPVEQAM
jgi:hypothetical protein